MHLPVCGALETFQNVDADPEFGCEKLRKRTAFLDAGDVRFAFHARRSSLHSTQQHPVVASYSFRRFSLQHYGPKHDEASQRSCQSIDFAGAKTCTLTSCIFFAMRVTLEQ